MRHVTRHLEIVEELGVEEVERIHHELYAAGRHGESPGRGFSIWLYEHGRDWVLARVPIDALIYQTEWESSEERIALSRVYARRTTELPPGIATYSERAWRRRSGKAYVADGNHRILAAIERGDDDVLMFMPAREFRVFAADARSRGLVI